MLGDGVLSVKEERHKRVMRKGKAGRTLLGWTEIGSFQDELMISNICMYVHVQIQGYVYLSTFPSSAHKA